MDEAIRQAKPIFRNTRGKPNQSYFQYHYEEVLKYRVELNKILEYPSGILEISYPYCYNVLLIEKTSKSIDLAQIDSFLSLIIDPESRMFTKEELVIDYGYPEDDVYFIDADYA